MKNISTILFSLIGLLSFSQITHYTWPTGTGEALLSDKYQVFVKNGNDPEQQIQVLMSQADPNDIQYDFRGTELTGRTFSFASLSYDKVTGAGLTFRVVKTYGNVSTNVKIAPKSYGITPTIGSNQVTFSINDNNKFISVNFVDTNNETNNDKWIKHMLTIFIDPPEVGAPNPTDPGVVTYSNSVSPTALANATTIYFPAGYHNLDNYPFASIIDFEGKITLQNGQKMYLAGGAFVEGIIQRQDFNNTNQKIYGRGILSGRQYIWQDGMGNKPYGEIIELGKFATVDGVHVMDSPHHGIVSPNNMTITNLKFLGWHANNDAIRVGQNSEIKNSFIRAVDDFFYNFDNYVHDCVLWAGHNGAIITYGWGGDGGSTYNSGGSTLDNIDIINPEWTGLGNNNGIVAAQIGLDYKPFPYDNGNTLTTLRNIRIEGSIPGILNLKPRSSGSGVPNAVQAPEANLGYLGDLQMENITVAGQSGKGRIRGQLNATLGGSTFFTKNVNFTNVFIGGTKLTDLNSAAFFDIEGSTTQNINFDIGIPPTPGSVYTETFDAVNINPVLQDGSNPGLNSSHISAIPSGDGEWYTVQGFGVTDFGIQTTGGNPGKYVSRISPSEFGRGLAYIYNNSDNSASGIYNINFDYFFNTSFDNVSTTNDRFGYKIYGITSTVPDGIFPMSSGSGDFGDNNSTNYSGTDATVLVNYTHLPHTNTWANSGNIAIDLGITSNYKYFVVAFGQVFGTVQTGNPVETYFGIDNVVLPTQSNPQVLSTKDLEKSAVAIYPNPVKDILNVKNIQGDFAYKIYDVSGKLLKASNKQSIKTIDISHLKKGIYFLELVYNNNRSTVKVVKN